MIGGITRLLRSMSAYIRNVIASRRLDAMQAELEISVLGSSCVGKSSIVKAFVGSSSYQLPLISTKNTKVLWANVLLKNSLYELRITDIKCREGGPMTDRRIIAHNMLNEVPPTPQIFLLVYDASNPTLTFKFVEDLRSAIIIRNNMLDAMMVVVNKMDLAEDANDGSLADHYFIARKLWRTEYHHVSAKYNYHIFSLFQSATTRAEAIQRNMSESRILPTPSVIARRALQAANKKARRAGSRVRTPLRYNFSTPILEPFDPSTTMSVDG